MALAILFIIFKNIQSKVENSLLGQKLFLMLIGSNAAMLLLDAVLWLSDGAAGEPARVFNTVFTAFYYALNPLPALLWCLYANYLVYKSNENIKRLFVPLCLPLAVNLVFSAVSGFNGCMFFFDAGDVYHRGPFFGLMAASCYAYLAYTLVFIIVKQKQIEQKFFVPVLVFVFPPVVGGILQTMFYGVSLVWVCMAVSVLVVFISTQNSQLYIDYLTGLYNRRHLDYYLEERIKSQKNGVILGAIMIDLNFFKSINDKWGHSAGDDALVATGRILRKSLSKKDLVYRYGGDEFVVIAEIRSVAELGAAAAAIKSGVEQFNRKSPAPYNISLSMGYDVYDFGSELSPPQFLKHIDDLMYENKKSLKNIL